jgi:hypothetical protein
MISIMSTQRPRVGYFGVAFLPDLFIGSLALLIVLPLALLLGGFRFIEPWFIVTPPTTFALGLFRGNSDGNVWLKSIGMNAILLALLARGTSTVTFSLGALCIVFPAVAGILVRRYRLRTQKKLSVQ